jgi:hypothetical protein
MRICGISGFLLVGLKSVNPANLRFSGRDARFTEARAVMEPLAQRAYKL